MEWIADPTVWLGLATLVALEIVLGVDNLIFIAILSDKLPPGQRDRARILDALSQFKRHTAELAIVVDPQGRFQGIVTRTDLLEAIVGEFPDEGE